MKNLFSRLFHSVDNQVVTNTTFAPTLKFDVIDCVSIIYKMTSSHLFVGIGFEGGGMCLVGLLLVGSLGIFGYFGYGLRP